jgi:hypothetical protein
MFFSNDNRRHTGPLIETAQLISAYGGYPGKVISDLASYIVLFSVWAPGSTRCLSYISTVKRGREKENTALMGTFAETANCVFRKFRSRINVYLY